MRGKLAFALMPAALAVPSAYAAVYMTPAQAGAALFPGEMLQPSFRTLDDGQVAAIRKASGVVPLGRQVKVWRASGGGWLVIDQVIGKHEFITFAVALDPDGAVRSVEILD
jgi:hypothetical protein